MTLSKHASNSVERQHLCAFAISKRFSRTPEKFGTGHVEGIVDAGTANNTIFGVPVMLIMGLLAYLMEENGFPLSHTILGIVLGTMLENNCMSSMIKADGEVSGFFSRPIAATSGVIVILLWLIPLCRFVYALLKR
ncbi:MAG: hypothetical protein AB8B63_23520 [Granulosicoccus sp.]